MNKFIAIFGVCLPLACSSIQAQNHRVVHLINNSGQDAVSQLNGSGHFTTSFKGTNDVSITMTNGSVNSIYLETLSSSATQTNPLFLTGFIGSSANASGDSATGDIKALETSLNSPTTLQFDFSVPLSAQDRILIFDCDSSEQYIITAFDNQQIVNLSSWTTALYSGQMNQLPDGTWPSWTTTSTNGTLTAGLSGNLVEPLFVLTPNQPVDRVIVKRISGGGSAAIQFLNLGVPSLHIANLNTNAVISWPDGFESSSLYEKFPMLNGPNAWVAVTNVPVLVSNVWYVTSHITTTNTFFRLKGVN